MLEWNELDVDGEMKWCLVENGVRLQGCDYSRHAVSNAHRSINDDRMMATSVAEALVRHAIDAGSFPASSEDQVAEFLLDWADTPFFN